MADRDRLDAALHALRTVDMWVVTWCSGHVPTDHAMCKIQDAVHKVLEVEGTIIAAQHQVIVSDPVSFTYRTDTPPSGPSPEPPSRGPSA